MKTNEHFLARNTETGRLIASRVTVATTRAQRAIGLLSRSHLEPGEGLWISPCRGVHTCFMRFSIDILAMDKDGVVVDVVTMLKPWRFRLPKAGSFSVLELPAGTLLSAPTKVGDRITIHGWNAAVAPSPNSELLKAAR